MSGNLDERLRLREDLRKLLCEVSDKYNISMSEQTQITRMLWDYDAAVKAALAALPEAASDERLKAALQASVIALDDWLHEYAPEWCGEPYVSETRERIASRGGTLAYIAKVQQENRGALEMLNLLRRAALPEASPQDSANVAATRSQLVGVDASGHASPTHPGGICTPQGDRYSPESPALPEASPRMEHNWPFEMAQQRVEIVERMMKLPYIKAQRDTEKGQERFVCRDDVITMIHNYAKELRAAVPETSEPPRCPICDWPLKQTVEEGCVPGNCSYRPHEGTAEYRRIEERKRRLAAPLAQQHTHTPEDK